MRLTILEHAGQPLREPLGKDFAHPGATIGRGTDNHLVLADETRQISRLQASVRIDDRGTYLANLSSVCPVEVNGAALSGDQFLRLQEGDRVRIGLYLLQVGTPPAAPPPAAVANDEAFWDDLVADFVPAPSAALFPASAPVLAPLAVAQAAAPEAHLPDDALATMCNASVDPLAFFADPAAESASNLFADSASSLPEASTALLELAQQEQVASALFGAPGASAPGASAPAYLAAAPGVDGASMIAAFLDGAGFTPNAGTLTPGHFHQAGRLLRKLVGGSMDLLASRTIIKREVKAELTMLLDKENNALKLLPDAATVLKQMFGPPFPGFMPAEQAIDDTFHDLQAHQMGMLAGMRAALTQLLRNFSPDVVEQQMGAGVWYERLLPTGRDGRAWVRYRALHQAAVMAVEDDFHTVFGQVFLSAYDAEVELYRTQRAHPAC